MKEAAVRHFRKNSHIKGTGLLIKNLKKKPKRDQDPAVVGMAFLTS